MVASIKKITLILLLILSTVSYGFEKVGTTSFQFLKVMMSARSTAMGGAYSSLAYGADAVFWNPGLLPTVQRFDAEFSYVDYFFDIRHSSFAAAYSAGHWGTLGVQVLLTDVGEIEETTVSALGFNADGTYNPGLTGNTFSPGAFVVGVSWARAVTDQFSFGLTTKFVREDLVAESASSLVFDGGLVYDTGYRSVKISATVRQFGPEVKFVEEKFPLPQTFNIGVSAYLMSPNQNMFRTSENHKLLVAFDMVQPRDFDQQYNVGMEYGFNDMVFLRGGYKINYDEEGLALGMGIHLQNYRFDYSFNDYGEFLDGVHRFTLGLNFD